MILLLSLLSCTVALPKTYWHTVRKVHLWFCQEATSRSASTDADVRFNLCYRHKHIECYSETFPPTHDAVAVHLHELPTSFLCEPCLHRSPYEPRLSLFLGIVRYFSLHTLQEAAATRHGVSNGADADSLRALRQSKGKV
jgi:hypothetical protein